MKGSSVLLPGWGPPVQVLPQLRQQQAPAPPPYSTFSSHFHSCGSAHRLSSRTIRQQQRGFVVNMQFQNGGLSLKNFRSSFHGESERLKRPSALVNVKERVQVRRPILSRKQEELVESRNFRESYQTRGTYPSYKTNPSTAQQPKFPPSGVEQRKTRYVDPPERLDQTGSESARESTEAGPNATPRRTTGKTSPQHREQRQAEEIKSQPRPPSPNSVRHSAPKITPSFVVSGNSSSGSSKVNPPSYGAAKYFPAQSDGGLEVQNHRRNQTGRTMAINPNWSYKGSQWESDMSSYPEIETVRRSPDTGADLLSNSHNPAPQSSGRSWSGMELSLMDPDETRSSQNGASTHKFKINMFKPRRPTTVQQALRDQMSLRNMAAESQRKSEAWQQFESSRHRSASEGSLGYQNAKSQGNNQVAQLEAPRHQTQIAGAAKWTEAANNIEVNRNPSYRWGAMDLNVGQYSKSVELGRAGDSVTRLPSNPIATVTVTVNEVVKIQEPEILPELLPREEGGEKSPAVSEGGGNEKAVQRDSIIGENENSMQREPVTEEPKTSTDVIAVGEAGLSREPEEQQQWLNEDVLVVDNAASAEAVVERLRGQYRDLVHACDTEVADIDVKKQSPVGHGRMICFSIYCGSGPDFGGGKSRIWVDVLQKPEVLEIFKAYFEDPGIKKVWHNYSFDRHVLANHGIHVQGFYADTMHLARLLDSARTATQGGYSLEGLTADSNLMDGHWGKLKVQEESGGKRSMKHLFGKPNIKKNGEEGKLRVVPPVEELQTHPEWQDKWIHYSSFDTVCTWCLWSSLEEKLKKAPWLIEGKFCQVGKSMYDFYVEYVQPFGELLVQMEAEGMMLDREHLANIEAIAIKQQEFAANQFKTWAAKRCPDAVYMNVGSDAQIRQLLFGGKAHRNDPEKRLEIVRTFTTPNTDNYIEEGRKAPKKTRPFTLSGLGVDLPVDTYTSAGWPAVGGAALKALAGKVCIDYNVVAEDEPSEESFLEVDSAEDSAVLTSTGVKGGSEEDLSVYGLAYEAFGGGKEGKEACMALAALCEVASINTLISNFIQPLQGDDIKGPDGRIHCSLNINTETGRLSARRPSLQNQPALEKDRYKIRQAFVAAPGKSLIVADYGQLELRILAHLTDCKSMLKAFSDGGDFHSRTAMNMYAHVRRAVEHGDVILEWEPKAGEKKPPVPLLKDVFGAERRKAKMLNFSIAYGKTAMGLSKDWKVSVDEAKSTVDLWYSDRKEVLSWQKKRIAEANSTSHVHTLLGRTRHFPDVKSSSRLIRGHIERAAINTPVQGSAADVAMCAMLEIHRNKTLQDLGWKLVLQVHDEVILEGPSESAAVAKDIVVKCMGFPFNGKNKLRVTLAVDAKFAQSWYAAK